jgi:hypothetical protein
MKVTSARPTIRLFNELNLTCMVCLQMDTAETILRAVEYIYTFVLPTSFLISDRIKKSIPPTYFNNTLGYKPLSISRN